MRIEPIHLIERFDALTRVVGAYGSTLSVFHDALSASARSHIQDEVGVLPPAPRCDGKGETLGRGTHVSRLFESLRALAFAFRTVLMDGAAVRPYDLIAVTN